MNELRIITFWVGVNIIGIPEYVRHLVSQGFYKKKEIVYAKSCQGLLNAD